MSSNMCCMRSQFVVKLNTHDASIKMRSIIQVFEFNKQSRMAKESNWQRKRVGESIEVTSAKVTF